MHLIKSLTQEGVVVAGGHTAAYGDEFNAAVNQGLSLSVHFLNGPSRSSSKSFRLGGAEQIMLKSDRVSLELICDGYHVDPAYVRDALCRKEKERIIMITDSMFANGLVDLRKFTLFGLHGAVSANRKYLQMLDSEDTLFGSVLSSRQGFNNLLNWLTQDMQGIWHRHHDALNLEDAIVTASLLASGNPARLLGIDKPAHKNNHVATGSINVGNAADLILAHITQDQNINFTVEEVMVSGEFLNLKYTSN